MYDAYSGLNIEHAGCYDLNGEPRAAGSARARHLQIQPDPSNHDPHTWPYEALSDIARIRRTHEFLRVLAAKVAARGLGNPITDQNILTGVLPDLTVDSGFSESKMASLAETFARTSIANVPQFTYPGSDVNSGFKRIVYQGYGHGDVVFPVQPNGFEAVNSIFGIKPGYNSFTDEALPAPSSIKLTVENGTGVTNRGRHCQSAARQGVRRALNRRRRPRRTHQRDCGLVRRSPATRERQLDEPRSGGGPERPRPAARPGNPWLQPEDGDPRRNGHSADRYRRGPGADASEYRHHDDLDARNHHVLNERADEGVHHDDRLHPAGNEEQPRLHGAERHEHANAALGPACVRPRGHRTRSHVAPLRETVRPSVRSLTRRPA